MIDFFGGLLEKLCAVYRTFSWTDALDIIIITFLIFGFIKLIMETRAEQLVKGIIVVLVVWFLSVQLNLKMMGWLLSNFFQFSILAMLLIFQPEIRRALERLGRTNIGTYFDAVKGTSKEDEKKMYDAVLGNICRVCRFFSSTKTGAIIVFEKDTKLKEIASTGTYIDAIVSQELIGNIFFNKAPLHDGAMIVRKNKILAAGCILPLTKNNKISSDMGTRHRAALGISEISDAVVVVVSEETGVISIALNGVITRNYTEETLKERLTHLVAETKKPNEKKESFRFFRRKSNEENAE